MGVYYDDESVAPVILLTSSVIAPIVYTLLYVFDEPGLYYLNVRILCTLS